MELRVFDTALNAVGNVDQFVSLIWTDRYSGYGDFEFYVRAEDFPSLLKTNYYLSIKESDRMMIIEDHMNDVDPEKGRYVKVTGRSLESILDRRIIWNQTILSGNLQNGIEKLLNENAINPTDPNRKISNLIFKASTDPAVTSYTVDAQFTGDNLYTAIKTLCDQSDLGFKITLNSSNQFVFELYAGANRSYIQASNPFVVFSSRFDNLIDSDYIDSSKTEKTVTLVAGEGEGSERKTLSVASSGGAGSGLDRKELFTDARDVSSNAPNGTTLTTEQYNAQLTQRGKADLASNVSTLTLDGKTDITNMYKYGTDFFMGDIVELENEYVQSTVRITEMVRSQSSSGISFLPTFKSV